MTEPQPLPRILKVPEAAALLRVSENWIYDHAGELGGFKVGRCVRFTEAGLLRYVKDASTAPATSARIQHPHLLPVGDPFELMRRARAMRKQGRKSR